MPQVVEAAGSLSTDAAAAQVLDRYIHAVGAASDRDILATFDWSPRRARQAATRAHLETRQVDGREVWTLPILWRGRI
jgi:hypothetical protein